MDLHQIWWKCRKYTQNQSIKIWDLSGLNSGSQIQISVTSGVHMWQGEGMHSTECPSSLILSCFSPAPKITGTTMLTHNHSDMDYPVYIVFYV